MFVIRYSKLISPIHAKIHLYSISFKDFDRKTFQKFNYLSYISIDLLRSDLWLRFHCLFWEFLFLWSGLESFFLVRDTFPFLHWAFCHLFLYSFFIRTKIRGLIHLQNKRYSYACPLNRYESFLRIICLKIKIFSPLFSYDYLRFWLGY